LDEAALERGGEAAGRIFFFLSHAAGSARNYPDLYPRIRKAFRTVPLDLSGHGARREERLLYSMEEIVEDLHRQAAASLEGAKTPPYHIFGHSMGALNAFLLAVKLTENGHPPPERLFLSSYSVPGWHPIPPGMAKLPDREMWEESALRFGVLNGEPVPSEERMRLFSPAYRADLLAVEGYRPPEPSPVLDAPLTVFYAENDMVDGELAGAWRDFSSRPLDLVKLPGGHFHPLENPLQLEDILLSRTSGPGL
jgi:surfactin synthase thioesterase subunit